ncbi:tetratricopeptide repeat protein [Myxococcus stipitatus]|uniref:tetratricopeptide repeat protein n=1 Tax=Myxococcus stipitatus TaxID=83455 RepID=UPI0030D542D0
MWMTLVSLLLLAGTADEEQWLVEQIASTCVGKAELARQAAQALAARQLDAALEKYTSLSRCAPAVPIVQRRMGLVFFEKGDFRKAEEHYRKALALEVTTTNQLALLQALVRQERTLDAPRRAEMQRLYDELMRSGGERVDIWSNLTYVAFHLDDIPSTRRAAQRAIALGATTWHPYFYGGMAEAVGESPNPTRALSLLERAEQLGGPKKHIASFRERLLEAQRPH